MSKKPVQRITYTPANLRGMPRGSSQAANGADLRTADAVNVDPTGKLAGRGAYLHDRRECWERGLKGALAHALKVNLSVENRTRLEEFMNALPQRAEAGE